MASHLPRTLVLSAAVLVGIVTGCSGDDDSAGGFDSAREVVDAHVSRSKAYDLAGDCELHHPDVVAEWAAADGREAEGYCEWATASLQADATPDQRARTTGIYTNPKVSAGTEDGDRATYTLEAADGSYHEEIVVVEIDGEWFLDSAEGSDIEGDHAH